MMAATDEEKKQNIGRFRVHAAIDFGTDGVGLAYTLSDHDAMQMKGSKHIPSNESKSNDNKNKNQLPPIISHNKWVSKKYKNVLKQKTIILLDKHLQFIKFGKKAKELYMELTDQKHNYYLFERFKMSLYEQAIISNKYKDYDEKKDNSQIEILNELTAANGKKVKSERVFIAAFTYLQDEAMRFLKKLFKKNTNPNLQDHEIQWIVTVPAIWNDSAKYKMTCWAVSAGLVDENIPNQLVIRYEPDCASLSLQYEMYSQEAKGLKRLQSRFNHLKDETINQLLQAQAKFTKGE
eukprot:486512_1